MGEVVYAPQFGSRPARTEHVGTVARVLIVDGDPAALAAIAQALQSEGHSTATAFDAAGAIAVAERLGPFDLVIADIASSGGIELAEILRRGAPGLPMLFVAGDDATSAEAVPVSHDADVIQKPFSESELVDAVSSLLYWGRPRSSR